MRYQKRGAGILILIAILAIALITVAGLQHMLRASARTTHATRGSAGAGAAALAESALQEGLWQFQKAVNDPAHPLFEQLRSEVYAPKAGDLDLGAHIKLEQTQAMLSQEAYRDFKIESFQPRVVYQRQFENLPYERFGLVSFKAKVSSAKAVREIELARGFKVVLAGLPRPFDQCGLYVGEGSRVTDLTSVNSRRRRYLDAVARLRNVLGRARRDAPAALADRYKDLDEAVPPREKLEEQVPELPVNPSSILFSVWRDGQFFPLENLDLDKKLQEDESAGVQATATLESAQAAFERSPADPAVHKALLDAIQAALDYYSKLLGRIWAFHEGFRMVDSSDEAHATLAANHERMRLEHWRHVAFFRITEGENGLGAQKQFDDLVKRIQPLSGIVLVENAKEPLRLTGELRGKLVVVTTSGGATLEKLNTEDRHDDLLTVISLGGPLKIAGEVHAAVAAFAAGDGKGGVGTVQMEDGAVLRGGLVLERIAPGSRLAGRVVRAAKHYSGTTGKGDAHRPLDDHYVVGVSPVDTYERIGRK